ncbi:hypothetical protein QYM36_005182 [Artemia franciscana]|uniref:Craniofacial development protein 2-like n=1 Tax=Artemia franciscana TaxID=6661 RepID=A0AA88HYR4_ARTSF|nr:hypothetical protein QYM36_005182 [Artemia franciscana]
MLLANEMKKLKGRISNVTTLSVYTPIRVSPDDAKDVFYFELQRILDSVLGSNILFVAGDFNARVGKSDAKTEGGIERYIIRERSQNGERLLSLPNIITNVW